MSKKSKNSESDYSMPDILLTLETPEIRIPIFPSFKKPSCIRHLKPNISSSPNKLEDNISVSTKISAVNSAGQTTNYIVNSYLQSIKKHIGQSTRSEVEGQIVKQLITQNGKLMFMLHMNWASYFTQYLQHKHDQPPGPVNNSGLFEGSQYKESLKQDIDFVLLNRNTWMFIHALYGGGPEVAYEDYTKQSRSTIDLMQQIFKSGESLSKLGLSRASSMQSNLIETQSYMSYTLPFKKSEFELPPVGFYNENNYCFMHAAIQSLLTVEQINCWMISEANKKTKESYKWLNAYNEIVTQVHSKKPGSFIKIITLKNLIKNDFDPKLQHDSQEFVRFFIDRLGTELTQHDQYEQPITDIVFYGQMLQLITCQHCNYKSSRLESFLDLSVSMTKLATLDGCLKQFFAQEFLTDHYQCENCTTERTAVKKYVIGTPPTFLMIHLKRFTITTNKVKLHGHVQFPLILDVQEYCSIQTKYKLRSIIVHYGTPEKGHYVNFSLRQNQWYYFDDHKIYNVSESDVLSQQAYVLFYEKNEEHILEA